MPVKITILVEDEQSAEFFIDDPDRRIKVTNSKGSFAARESYLLQPVEVVSWERT